MSDRLDFMSQDDEHFRKHCGGGDITGLAEGITPIRPAADHSARALQTDPMTSALSHATNNALFEATRARRVLHRNTIDYVARLIREALPDAAAITVDTRDGELFEVRDGHGTALYRAPFTPASPLHDSLADDIEDLFRHAFPFGGLDEAGWETAAEGLPYRSIILPDVTRRGTARSHFPTPEGMASIHCEYTPGVAPGFQIAGPDSAFARETRDRIRAAIVNSGLEWKPGLMQITAHWTVAQSGSSADLAIACTALAAAGAIDPAALNNVAVIGELGLDGMIRPVPDVMGAVRTAQLAGYRKFVVNGTRDFDTVNEDVRITVVGPNDLNAALAFLHEMYEPTTTLDAGCEGTPEEDAGKCAQCDERLVWDSTGRCVHDTQGGYFCYGPRRAGRRTHVLAD